MDIYKLHIKIGPHEFNGEGPEESVKNAFEDWKSLIGDLPRGNLTLPSTTASSPMGATTPLVLESEQLVRLFVTDDKRGLVSLRILPRGENREQDAVLLILLGFKRVKDQDEVLVTQLKPALKQSGCNVARVDSVVAKYLRDGLINKGGMGKGGRYSLTNSGAEKAISLASGLLA